MKFFHTHLNLADNIDGWIDRTLKLNVTVVPTLEECDVVVYSFVWQEKFVFDSELAQRIVESEKPVIVFDYHEHTEVHKTTVLGWRFTEKMTENYRCIHNLFLRHPPRLYFKREFPNHFDFVSRTAPFPLVPVDYVHEFPDVAPDDCGAYWARPLDVLMFYGYSHISRYLLHAALLKECRYQGWTVLNSHEDFDWWMQRCKPGDKCIGLMPVPHYRRIPIEKINLMQSKAKITVSCYGAGIKCWRSSEAGYNSLVAHQDPSLVRWGFEWKPGDSCLSLRNECGNEVIDAPAAVSVIVDALTIERDDLYLRYLRSVAQTSYYGGRRYFEHYVLPLIKSALSLQPGRWDSSGRPVPVEADCPAAPPNQDR